MPMKYKIVSGDKEAVLSDNNYISDLQMFCRC